MDLKKLIPALWRLEGRKVVIPGEQNDGILRLVMV